MDDTNDESQPDHVWLFESSAPDAGGVTGQFREPVADSQVVGLGTACGGARESNRFRHRVARDLVETAETTVAALPIGFADGQEIDQYVVGETDDRKGVVDTLSGTEWAADSILELIEWLREYNGERPDHERVRVYGLGAGTIPATADRLQEYLDRVDPPYLETIRHNLSAIREGSPGGLSGERGAPLGDDLGRIIDETKRLLPTVRDRLDENREEYVTTAGVNAWSRARQYTTLLEQRISLCLSYKQYHQREIDRKTTLQRVAHLQGLTMADNLDWVLEFEEPEQLVVFGHDTEIARTEQRIAEEDLAYEDLGALLDRRYGSEYYALGTVFGGGSVRTDWHSPTDEGVVQVSQITSDNENTGPGPFDAPIALLDARTSNDTPGDEDRQWIPHHESVRTGGQGHRFGLQSEGEPARYVTESDPSQAFDGLCYFQSVTPAQMRAPHEE